MKEKIAKAYYESVYGYLWERATPADRSSAYAFADKIFDMIEEENRNAPQPPDHNSPFPLLS
jgi:hypothetical protein